MQQSPLVLIVSDRISDSEGWFTAGRCSLMTAPSMEIGMKLVKGHSPDIVVVDSSLTRGSGFSEALGALGENSTLVIARKPSRRLLEAVSRLDLRVWKEEHSVAEEISRLVDQDDEANLRRRRLVKLRRTVIGESEAMNRLWEQAFQFAPTEIPILLQGETGTGKELMAWAIHELSHRNSRQLVPIDCTTLPEELFESELFGHHRGAFTGAMNDKKGRVAAAHGGTMFLDELGTLTPASQTKLLRLVEKRTYTPLGAEESDRATVDARFISAANVPLKTAVDDGAFREDLYYRLNGVTIHLPPLRDRNGDIARLARHFLAEACKSYDRHPVGFSPEAVSAMKAYHWPGNVRELQRVVSVAAVRADEKVQPGDLQLGSSDPLELSRGIRLAIDLPWNLDQPLDLNRVKEFVGREAERRIIQRLSAKRQWTQKELAQYLSVDPKTLRARLRELGSEQLKGPTFRAGYA